MVIYSPVPGGPCRSVTPPDLTFIILAVTASLPASKASDAMYPRAPLVTTAGLPTPAA